MSQTLSSIAITSSISSLTPGTAAANLGKAEDAAHATGDTGVMSLAVRQDTATQLAGSDGDYTPLITDASGRLHTLEGNSAAIKTAVELIDDVVKTEDAAHSGGDKGVMALAVRQDSAAALAGADGDYSPLQVDANGALRVTGGGGGTEVTEDAAAAANPTGGQLMARRRDSLSGETSADGDVVALNSTDKGELYVKHADSVTVQATNLDVRDLAAASDSVAVHGDVGVLDQFDLTNSNPAAVAIVDANGDQISSFGGGTQYTEDAAAAANPVGTALNLIRADSLAGLTSADGDNVAARGTDKGELYVKHADAVPVTDNSGSLTVDAPVGTPVFVRLSDGSSAISTLPVSLASVPSHAVTNAGTFAVQVDGSALTALQKIDDPVLVDDAAFTPATSSVMMMGAQLDDSSPDSVDEGDAGAVRMSSNRNLYVRIRDNAGNERGLNIDANGALAATVTNATATNLNAAVVGNASSGASDSGGPVKVGAIGVSTEPASVTSGQRVNFYATLSGKQIVLPYSLPENNLSGTASATDTSNTQVIAAQGAGIRIYVTTLIVYNASATDTYVNIKDGTTTKLVVPAPKNSGAVVPLPVPLRLTGNTALNFACGASVTTMHVSGVGYAAV